MPLIFDAIFKHVDEQVAKQNLRLASRATRNLVDARVGRVDTWRTNHRELLRMSARSQWRPTCLRLYLDMVCATVWAGGCDCAGAWVLTMLLQPRTHPLCGRRSVVRRRRRKSLGSMHFRQRPLSCWTPGSEPCAAACKSWSSAVGTSPASPAW